MQSILGILYSVSQMQNFGMLDAVIFGYFVLILSNAKFLHLVHAECLLMNNTACKN